MRVVHQLLFPTYTVIFRKSEKPRPGSRSDLSTTKPADWVWVQAQGECKWLIWLQRSSLVVDLPLCKTICQLGLFPIWNTERCSKPPTRSASIIFHLLFGSLWWILPISGIFEVSRKKKSRDPFHPPASSLNIFSILSTMQVIGTMFRTGISDSVHLTEI